MRLSSMADYAVVTMSAAARHCGHARVSAAQLAAETGLPAPTAAGHAIAHHTLVLHRSPRNTSPRPRRAWAMSWVTPAARWAPQHAPHPRSAVAPRAPGDPLEAELLRCADR